MFRCSSRSHVPSRRFHLSTTTVHLRRPLRSRPVPRPEEVYRYIALDSRGTVEQTDMFSTFQEGHTLDLTQSSACLCFRFLVAIFIILLWKSTSRRHSEMLVSEYAGLVHGQHVEGLRMERLQLYSSDSCEDALRMLLAAKNIVVWCTLTP
jgi:hypothetical protein